jgi:RHS repeat-associated protein
MSTTAGLTENSHRGFEAAKRMLCLASIDAKPNVASGMQAHLRWNGTGSRCSGKERDSNGLDYFGARYYWNHEGLYFTERWISPDPVMATPYDPPQLNKYSYVRSDPVNLVDPDGQFISTPSPFYADAPIALMVGGGFGGFYDATYTSSLSGGASSTGPTIISELPWLNRRRIETGIPKERRLEAVKSALGMAARRAFDGNCMKFLMAQLSSLKTAGKINDYASNLSNIIYGALLSMSTKIRLWESGVMLLRRHTTIPFTLANTFLI